MSDPEQCSVTLEACNSSLAQFNLSPSGPAGLVELQSRVREVVRTVSILSKKQIDHTLLQRVFRLQQALTVAGLHEIPVGGTELALANELKDQGLGGLLGAMLLVPAWVLPTAPDLGDVPSNIWGEYASWLFYSPEQVPSETGQFSSHWLKRLKSLEHWVQRNAGSTAVRAALEAYLKVKVNPELFPLPENMQEQAKLRGKILRQTQSKDRLPYEVSLTPRDGRRLRVGFVARTYGPGVDLFTALPCFEYLDVKQHEVFLLALEESDTPEAKYATQRAKLCQVLPSDWTARLETIRSGKLDVLVFVGDFSGGSNDIARLALHRLAGLQVVIQRHGSTTGLPEVDLYVSGALAETPETGKAFTERIGLLRGPAHAFNFINYESSPALTKVQLGITDGVTALASVVTSSGVSRSMLQTWVGILAQNAKTKLYVAYVQDDQTTAIEDFCSQIDTALRQRGVETSRVTIFPSWGGAANDIRSLLAWADIYLDSADTRSPVWLAEALVAGLPAISLQSSYNADLNASAAMLSAVNVPELIATDSAHYTRLALGLAEDSARRSTLQACIKSAVGVEPEFLDSLATSDAFGALITTAYDELTSLGREQFRQQQEPLRCFGVESASETVESGLAAFARGDLDSAAFESSLAIRSQPANCRARYLHGLVLDAQGEHSRAVDYLLAAVQRPESDGDTWLALARALRDNRQLPQAIEALEACMRLAPRQVEPLLMMLDLAEAVGSTDIAREVLQVLQQVAPDDARVLAMS